VHSRGQLVQSKHSSEEARPAKNFVRRTSLRADAFQAMCRGESLGW